jgi:hypothetical protein
MSRYVQMECPECHRIWKGWVPCPRDEYFLEKCHGCEKIVHFIEIKQEDPPVA